MPELIKFGPLLRVNVTSLRLNVAGSTYSFKVRSIDATGPLAGLGETVDSEMAAGGRAPTGK